MLIDDKTRPGETGDNPWAACGNIEMLLRPASIAILGVSAKPGAAGEVVLTNLLNGGFAGEIYLLGRGEGEVLGRKILTDLAAVPDNIDLAILILPAGSLRAAIEQCIAKGVKSAVCFASGFAEMGEEGRRQQEEIGALAAEAGLALVGPNTVGYFNYIDGFHALLVDQEIAPPLPADSGPGIAVLAQSGGIGAHIGVSLQQRFVPVSYVMTTGNEAHLGLSDFIDYLADDPRTGAIAIYAEQIKDPRVFLKAARKAQKAGKPVVLMHPGRSENAKHATSSHTGALAGNHAAMRIAVEQAGVVVVDTLEEVIDVAQLLLRYPNPPTGGLGVLTGSGAVCAITLDYVEPLGIEVPPLGAAQVDALREHLPDYTPPRNPLDVGTLVGWKPELLRIGAENLLADPAIGALLVSFPMAGADLSVVWMKSYLEGIRNSAKPSIYVIHNEDRPLADALVALIESNKVIVMRSPERALRALAKVLNRPRAAMGARVIAGKAEALPKLGIGPQPEWLGKAALKAIGIPVPQGALASSDDEAVRIAGRIGYPVVMKAQAAQLAHKSEAGGVLLNLADEAAVRAAWRILHENIARYSPGMALDGVLVEAMGARGLELVVGANRDPRWGPAVLVGLGGIWVEALGDVRLIPPGLPHDAIVAEIKALKAAKLLNGFRGSKPVDIDAVARCVAAIGQMMLDYPEITEIDVNPLVVYPQGQGVVALDALIVTAGETGANHA